MLSLCEQDTINDTVTNYSLREICLEKKKKKQHRNEKIKSTMP